jgi:hypothetical protein
MKSVRDVAALRTTEPEADPAVERLLIEARSSLPRRLPARELRYELLAASAFIAAAVALAVSFSSPRTLDWPLAVALVVTYAAASHMRFHTGSFWTDPTQLVFVPMLFLLPTQLVPLFVASALIGSRLPDYLRRRVHPSRVLIMVGDSWYAIGPALVLAAAGAQTAVWGDWAIYIAALAAQLAFDFGRAVLRSGIELGDDLRSLVKESAPIWVVDVLLSPVGLLIAFASAMSSWAFLLTLPLMGLFTVFSRERDAHIETALNLSHAYRGTAHLLGELLTGSSAYTGAHSQSVVALAHDVGVRLELDEAVLRDVELGALLHDVGKINVPDSILDKKGPLTDEEWEVMRGHTIDGERMLVQVGGLLAEVGAIVRSHHEHYDGSGYPDGLRGEQIPLPSRIISCCDAFNAMTTTRSYRRAMSLDAALAELRANAGSQFDPRVVDALVGLIEAGEVPGLEPAAEPTDSQTVPA